MRLALKVVFAVVAGILLVLTLFGYIRAHREIALFDSEIRKDHRLIGSTLSLCVRDALLRDGEHRAMELVSLADVDQPGLRIAWVYPNGNRTEEPVATVSPELARANEIAHHQVPGIAKDDDYLVTYVPVMDAPSAMLGAIEIAETLGPRDAYVRASIVNTTLATVAMSLTTATLVLVFGVWLIGRPLDQLAAKARRVGAGDLTSPLRLRQTDEIGQLAQEMNAMCDRLAEANTLAATETTARIKALEQLRHADRLITVGTLAAGVAHELGTPLNVVSGRAKMIQRGTERNTAIEYARVIVEQCERMTATIRQLLDFARRREPKTARVDLAAILRSTASLLGHMAKKRDVALVIETKPAEVTADAVQLEQVATNLLVNALHASNADSSVIVSTGVEAASPPGGTPTDYAFIRVRDFGHGMDPQTASHVFEPFFTTKDVGQGAGLGLSVAHGIVEGHAGFIHVESTKGEGACFTVYLPLARK